MKFFIFISLFLTTVVKAEWVSTICDSKTFSCRIVNGRRVESAKASALFKDEELVDGWGKLYIDADDSSMGYFGAGFLEGYLLSNQIRQHYDSWYSATFEKDPLHNETKQFLWDQYHYTLKLINENDNPHYTMLGKIIAQLQGLSKGIAYKSEHNPLSMMELLVLEAAGDLYDIIPATKPEMFKLSVSKLDRHEFQAEFHRAVSCSALIKMNDDKSDIFAGHTTWSTYENMLRVYKTYKFGTKTTSFSSKPGLLHSKDDFYVMPHSKLVVMETTNGIMDKDMYKRITSKSLLSWQLVRVCNTLAESGKMWTDCFAEKNSGTYANQWMVVDMKEFSPGVGVADGFLWIMEAAPKLFVAKDLTDVFRGQGNYWPSMNVPYFKEVYNASGFQHAYEKYGDDYSYTQNPRYKIFARDQERVQTMDGIKTILRFNKYQTDPLSKSSPVNAISSRKDLDKPEHASAFGGIDSKATSYKSITSETGHALVVAENGPTHDTQEPFCWSKSQFKKRLHYGQPDCFKFGFVDIYQEPAETFSEIDIGTEWLSMM